MGIYIKGMRMPENCIQCPMQFGGMCNVMPAEVDESRVAPTVEDAWKQGKPDWCPLVEIKEPHGDLIDRDALVKDLTNGIKAGLLLDGYEKYQNINNTDDCVECVKYTDAVIEAEGSENDERVDDWTCYGCNHRHVWIYAYPCSECHEGSKYTEEGSENHAD